MAGLGPLDLESDALPTVLHGPFTMGNTVELTPMVNFAKLTPLMGKLPVQKSNWYLHLPVLFPVYFSCFGLIKKIIQHLLNSNSYIDLVISLL